uniref:Uncharacterized protein n=1 Tax=Rhizoctonia cerealis orthocurvulavirus TaxID=3068670 RepID=A0AA51GJS9_9VIRU|nr:MAG: hypothetical protein [Rhizoctonia cerealis orthocurvulavirus]
MTTNYADNVAELMRKAGVGQMRAAAPTTIDEAALPTGAAPTTEAGATKMTDIIPMPKEGMSLVEMKDLYDAYTKIVEMGAFLANWTDMKGASTSTNDPVELGLQRMSALEARLYGWWIEHGVKDEFNWKTCRVQGSTPAAKEDRVKKELAGMQWMYDNPEIDRDNFYWLRAEKPQHFNVVLAYTKIISAAHDIVGGAPERDAMAFKEYQTAKKIIGTMDSNVNEFMRGIHKILQPLQEAKNVVEARKVWAAKKCGITLKTEGTLGHQRKEVDIGRVGVITRPDERPKGQRVERTSVTTLDQLMRMKRKAADDEIWEDEMPLPLHRKRVRTDVREASPEYRPQSPEPVRQAGVDNDLSRGQADLMSKAIEEGMVEEGMVRTWAFKRPLASELDEIRATNVVKAPGGRERKLRHQPRSKAADVLYTAINNALAKEHIDSGDLYYMFRSTTVADDLVTTRFLTLPVQTHEAVEKWRKEYADKKKGGKKPAQGASAGDEEEMTEL